MNRLVGASKRVRPGKKMLIGLSPKFHENQRFFVFVCRFIADISSIIRFRLDWAERSGVEAKALGFRVRPFVLLFFEAIPGGPLKSTPPAGVPLASRRTGLAVT